jgi:hypothetical protein
MDACPYEDAFPNFDTGTVHRGAARPSGSGFPYVGGTDAKPTREERRAARKKAKKCKGPALEYSNLMADSMPAEVESPGLGGSIYDVDPDRPAMQRMPPVESMVDQRGGFKIPVLPKASCLYSDAGTPSYFGASSDDDPSEEGYSNFMKTHGEADYMLGGESTTKASQHAAAYGGEGGPAAFSSFALRGANKAAGATLPDLNLVDSWKPLGPASSYTAYLNDLPSMAAALPGWASGSRSSAPPAGPIQPPMERPTAPASEHRFPTFPPSVPAVVPAGGNQKEDRDALLARIEALSGRLEELEHTRRQDSQHEILMFVGTGLFMLFAFDMITRVRSG